MSSTPTLDVSPFSVTKYEYTMKKYGDARTIHTCQIIIIINMGKYALSKSGFNFYIWQRTKHIIRTKLKIWTWTNICLPDWNFISFINHEATTMIDKICKYANQNKIDPILYKWTSFTSKIKLLCAVSQWRINNNHC